MVYIISLLVLILSIIITEISTSSEVPLLLGLLLLLPRWHLILMLHHLSNIHHISIVTLSWVIINPSLESFLPSSFIVLPTEYPLYQLNSVLTLVSTHVSFLDVALRYLLLENNTKLMNHSTNILISPLFLFVFLIPSAQ